MEVSIIFAARTEPHELRRIVAEVATTLPNDFFVKRAQSVCFFPNQQAGGIV